MGKTVRRKNFHGAEWHLFDYDFRPDGSREKSRLIEDKAELGKQKRFLYGDSDSGVWNPPKRFRKSLNRQKRRKNDRELMRAVRYEEYDNLVLTKWFGDAGWFYW